MYTLVLRKGKIELELTTDDKEAIEKQLSLVITGASKVVSNNNVSEQVKTEPIKQDDPIPEVLNNEEPTVTENQIEEPLKDLNNDISEKSETKYEDIIATGISVTPYNPVTINSLQNPEPPKEPNFDDILNNEMGQDNTSAPITKDDNFVNYVESKSAIEKLDFLVVTAQYLAQYENMNTFNLKHINAKLMQNFTLIVDHSVLQSAISREYITRIQEGIDDTTTEYMLTEKGLRSY